MAAVMPRRLWRTSANAEAFSMTAERIDDGALDQRDAERRDQAVEAGLPACRAMRRIHAGRQAEGRIGCRRP